MSNLTYIAQLDDPEGFVKFGKTNSPKNRISTLATGTPWSVRLICLIGSDIERELKKEFAADKVRGEWFRPTQRLQDWIDTASTENRLVRQVTVDQAYVNAVIKPRILEYLAGREPNSNAQGDLVARILADRLPSLAGREKDLAAATKYHVGVPLSKGWCPSPESERLVIPGITAAERPAQDAAA